MYAFFDGEDSLKILYMGILVVLTPTPALFAGYVLQTEKNVGFLSDMRLALVGFLTRTAVLIILKGMHQTS